MAKKIRKTQEEILQVLKREGFQELTEIHLRFTRLFYKRQGRYC
jgi:hypothetical protein